MAPKKGTGWTLEEEPEIRPRRKAVLLAVYNHAAVGRERGWGKPGITGFLTNLPEKFITIFLAIVFSVFVGDAIRKAYFAGDFLRLFFFTIAGLVLVILFPLILYFGITSVFKITQLKKENLISSAHSIVTATIIIATLGPTLVSSIKSDLATFLILMVYVIIFILASCLTFYLTFYRRRAFLKRR